MYHSNGQLRVSQEININESMPALPAINYIIIFLKDTEIDLHIKLKSNITLPGQSYI
jgi:hypothetical protein